MTRKVQNLMAPPIPAMLNDLVTGLYSTGYGDIVSDSDSDSVRVCQWPTMLHYAVISIIIGIRVVYRLDDTIRYVSRYI